MKVSWLVAVLAVCGFLAAACGGDDGGGTTGTTGGTGGTGGGGSLVITIAAPVAAGGTYTNLAGADVVVSGTVTGGATSLFLAISGYNSGNAFAITGTGSFNTNIGKIITTAGSRTVTVRAFDAAFNVQNASFTLVLTNASGGGTGSSFEEWTAGLPVGWNHGIVYGYGINYNAVTEETSDVHEGSKAVKLEWTALGSGNAPSFWTQYDNVSPGELIFLRMHAKGLHPTESNSIQIGIAYYNATSNFITGQSTFIKDYGNTPNAWTEYKGVGNAPAGTAFAVFYVYGRVFTGYGGSVLIDDYAYGRVAEMDSANPTITLTSPASGTYGKGSLPIAATGTDDLAVKAFVALFQGTSNYLPATAGAVNTTIDTSGITAGGPYTLTVYALDYANKKSSNETRDINLTNVAAGPLVFTNSDFEADIPGAMDSAFSYSSTAFAGLRSIRFATNFINAGSVTTRTYNLSGVNNMYTNESFRYLTFMFRGTVTGTNPGLRFQVSNGGTIVNYYDINGITSGSTWTVVPTTGGTFPSTAINVTEWTKVKLDLQGVNWNSLNITQYPLRFRARQQTSAQEQTQHDWLIDDVRFEN